MNKNAATICLMLAGALLGAGPLCAQKPLPVAGAKALVNTNAPKMLLPKNAAVSAPGAGAGLQAATQAAQVQSLFSSKSKSAKAKNSSQKNFSNFLNRFFGKKIVPSVPVPSEYEMYLARQAKMTYDQVLQLWKDLFGSAANVPLLRSVFMPTQYPTQLSINGNKQLLLFSQTLAEKIDWLRQYPEQGRNDLAYYTGNRPVAFLARELAQYNLVMLGEVHYSENVQDFVSSLMRRIKIDNPNRRVVVFTEFLPIPQGKADTNADVASYYRRGGETELAPLSMTHTGDVDYAPFTFWCMLKSGVEVYPLEDYRQKDLFEKDAPGEFVSMAALLARNKSWARIMEHKMAEIRRTDPDALFVVYAGMGHTSWVTPFSLPKFFASQSPAVVELHPDTNSPFNTVYPVWGKNAPLFQPAGTQLVYWVGNSARLLGKQTGFNYSVAVGKTFDI